MSAIKAYFDYYRGIYDSIFYRIYQEKDSKVMRELKTKHPEIILQYKTDFELLLSPECNQYELMERCLIEIKEELFHIPKENQANFLWDKILPLILKLKNYFDIKFDVNGKNLNLSIHDEFTEHNRYKPRYGLSIIDIQNIVIKSCIGDDKILTEYESYVIESHNSWMIFLKRIHAICFSLGISFIQLQFDKGIIVTDWFDRSSLDFYGYPYEKQSEEIKLLSNYPFVSIENKNEQKVNKSQKKITLKQIAYYYKITGCPLNDTLAITICIEHGFSGNSGKTLMQHYRDLIHQDDEDFYFASTERADRNRKKSNFEAATSLSKNQTEKKQLSEALNIYLTNYNRVN